MCASSSFLAINSGYLQAGRLSHCFWLGMPNFPAEIARRAMWWAGYSVRLFSRKNVDRLSLSRLSFFFLSARNSSEWHFIIYWAGRAALESFSADESLGGGEGEVGGQRITYSIVHFNRFAPREGLRHFYSWELSNIFQSKFYLLFFF